jgi:thioredoxin-like negative regulator of GroEL
MLTGRTNGWSDYGRFRDVCFAKINVRNLPGLIRLSELPGCVIFKDGNQVDEFVGTDHEGLRSLVEKYA